MDSDCGFLPEFILLGRFTDVCMAVGVRPGCTNSADASLRPALHSVSFESRGCTRASGPCFGLRRGHYKRDDCGLSECVRDSLDQRLPNPLSIPREIT